MWTRRVDRPVYDRGWPVRNGGISRCRRDPGGPFISHLRETTERARRTQRRLTFMDRHLPEISRIYTRSPVGRYTGVRDRSRGRENRMRRISLCLATSRDVFSLRRSASAGKRDARSPGERFFRFVQRNRLPRR